MKDGTPSGGNPQEEIIKKLRSEVEGMGERVSTLEKNASETQATTTALISSNREIYSRLKKLLSELERVDNMHLLDSISDR